MGLSFLTPLSAARSSWWTASEPSQAYQSWTCSPVRTDSGRTATSRLRLRAWSSSRRRSKSTWGRRSILLTTTRSAAANMVGYFSGLSSPSVTEMTTTRACSPTSKSAGHTRLPTFSTNSSEPGTGSSARRERPTMSASRWQPEPVLTWTARAPARSMRSASKDVSWSPSTT